MIAGYEGTPYERIQNLLNKLPDKIEELEGSIELRTKTLSDNLAKAPKYDFVNICRFIKADEMSITFLNRAFCTQEVLEAIMMAYGMDYLLRRRVGRLFWEGEYDERCPDDYGEKAAIYNCESIPAYKAMVGLAELMRRTRSVVVCKMNYMYNTNHADICPEMFVKRYVYKSEDDERIDIRLRENARILAMAFPEYVPEVLEKYEVSLPVDRGTIDEGRMLRIVRRNPAISLRELHAVYHTTTILFAHLKHFYNSDIINAHYRGKPLTADIWYKALKFQPNNINCMPKEFQSITSILYALRFGAKIDYDRIDESIRKILHSTGCYSRYGAHIYHDLYANLPKEIRVNTGKYDLSGTVWPCKFVRKMVGNVLFAYDWGTIGMMAPGMLSGVDRHLLHKSTGQKSPAEYSVEDLVLFAQDDAIRSINSLTARSYESFSLDMLPPFANSHPRYVEIISNVLVILGAAEH